MRPPSTSSNISAPLGLMDTVPSIQASRLTLRRRDSTFSAGSDYQYASDNDMNFWQGAALLTAECLGTGILALPNNMKILGWSFGLSFLILNAPINLYAGTILSNAADFVERRQAAENIEYQSMRSIDVDMKSPERLSDTEPAEDKNDNDADDDSYLLLHEGTRNYTTMENSYDGDDHHHSLHHDTATFDFIGMTSALFRNSFQTHAVMILFYTNLFLVLGDYILVMSHAVAALLGEGWLCIPQAGLLASTLMFAVSQLRTMANLGRAASVVSLLALLIVIIQCIYFAHYNDENYVTEDGGRRRQDNVNSYESDTIFRKLSAMGSIGFATGTQKLFLNIRHELADRNSAPKSLAVSLVAFASFYVIVIVLAGSNPPSFLFDAIPPGIGRRLAGLCLWIHVAISYAINSQAICASMDRIFFYRWGPVKNLQDKDRWMILTGIMAVSAFFISNAIPFFKDLVALIGALTSIPLSLLLPAICHRQVIGVPLWLPTFSSLTSFGLVVFSVIFTITALIGSLDSIGEDWKNNAGGFFTCHQE